MTHPRDAERSQSGPEPSSGSLAEEWTRYNGGMGILSPTVGLSPQRVRLARLIALAVDFFQVIAFPLFFGGPASPVTDLLDVVTAVVLTALVGWHWAFAPTLLVEVVPVLDLFPTWTAAVFFVTRGQSGASSTGPPSGTAPSGSSGRLLDSSSSREVRSISELASAC
jgi:hypothetical protein